MSVSVKFLSLSCFIWAVIFALGSARITDPITKTTVLLLAPATTSLNRLQIQVKNELAVIVEARTLVNKYRALEKQNLQLRSEVTELTIFQEENSKLREQLGAPVVDKFKLVPAKIISKENGMTVIFDKTNTVAAGAIVVYKNNFVGRVKNATDRTATITLVTDPSMHLPVSILNTQKKVIKGVSSGQFGTGILVERIEQNELIEQSNLVTLDKAPGTPTGVVVGEVSEIRKVESDLFQKARVKSFIEFDTLDTVFIIQ